MAQQWQTAGNVADLSEDTPMSVELDGKTIGIYTLGGELYALEDVCPHAYALLSQGFVEGCEIECPLHGARFDIPSGRCTREPGGRDLKRYPVRVENGDIQVCTDEAAAPPIENTADNAAAKAGAKGS